MLCVLGLEHAKWIAPVGLLVIFDARAKGVYTRMRNIMSKNETTWLIDFAHRCSNHVITRKLQMDVITSGTRIAKFDNFFFLLRHDNNWNFLKQTENNHSFMWKLQTRIGFLRILQHVKSELPNSNNFFEQICKIWQLFWLCKNLADNFVNFENFVYKFHSKLIVRN